MDKQTHELNDEIMQLTDQLKLQYPQLYRHLIEMPITIPSSATAEIKLNHLKDYIRSLKVLIKTGTRL